MRRLTGCIAVLSRFISKSAERALSFFKILKKAGPMKWTPKEEATSQELKTYLSFVPTLVAPRPQEALLLYLAATNQVVSAALLAQREVDEAESEQDRQSQIRNRAEVSTVARATRRTRQGRKWCSAQCTLSAPCCKGLDRGTMVCKS